MGYNERNDKFVCEECGLCFDYEDDYLDHELDCKDENYCDNPSCLNKDCDGNHEEEVKDEQDKAEG